MATDDFTFNLIFVLCTVVSTICTIVTTWLAMYTRNNRKESERLLAKTALLHLQTKSMLNKAEGKTIV